jgi:GTP-binding protein
VLEYLAKEKRMINFHSAHYVISCPDLSFRPKDKLKEFAFFGRSNVGKSTLINTLCGQKVAFASKKAGKTRYLNYFLIDDKFYLVDTPGYGYTNVGNYLDEGFATMMEGYFQNPQLVGAFFLLDSRRSLNEDDRMLLHFLKKSGLPFSIVFTKVDQAKQSEIAARKKEAAEFGVAMVYFVSPKVKIDPLRALIAKEVER